MINEDFENISHFSRKSIRRRANMKDESTQMNGGAVQCEKSLQANQTNKSSEQSDNMSDFENSDK